VVQTLVDFTRPVELKLTETDLRRIIEDVVALASPEAELRGIRIDRSTPVFLPVKADVDLMKQALLNVVLNGVQAMPEGGALTITAHRNENYAEIDVHDEGHGIPPAVRDKIFNLYFTTKEKGTGIGLAMTYRVMQLHNGSVAFESPQNQGTTFQLRLPLLDTRQSVGAEAVAREQA
jgi:signal transduction histidine kinase